MPLEVRAQGGVFARLERDLDVDLTVRVLDRPREQSQTLLERSRGCWSSILS